MAARLSLWLQIPWLFAAWGAAVIVGPLRKILRLVERERWARQIKAEAWGTSLRHRILGAFARLIATGAVAAVMVVLLGAALPSLGVRNFGAALNLNSSGLPQAHAGTRIEPPPGYRPPADCKGYVSLTYDDGPGHFSVPLADTLRTFGLTATFFQVGTNVQARPDDVATLRRMGMQIEAHSMTHANLAGAQQKGEPGARIYGEGHVLTGSELHYEIGGSADAIEEALGERPDLFRPPYGYSSPKVRKIANTHGMNEALWTLDTNDWKGKSAREIGNIVKKAKNGTIVLMHDDSEVDIDAVPYIADVLTRKGLCTVHLTQGTGEHFSRDGLTFKTVPAGSDRPR